MAEVLVEFFLNNKKLSKKMTHLVSLFFFVCGVQPRRSTSQKKKKKKNSRWLFLFFSFFFSSVCNWLTVPLGRAFYTLNLSIIFFIIGDVSLNSFEDWFVSLTQVQTRLRIGSFL